MPDTVIPMSTTDSLLEAQYQGHVINRACILTSRDHQNPGDARDGLAEWAQKNNFDAVVGVCFVATSEVLTLADIQTAVRWAAYGTAIGW
jgi:hypothetical protein